MLKYINIKISKILTKIVRYPFTTKKVLLPYVSIKVSIIITNQYGNDRFLKKFSLKIKS